MIRTPKNLYRSFAIAEAITWTLLIVGLITRATLGWDVFSIIAGSVHGFVFLVYCTVTVLVAVNNHWHPGRTILAIAAAFIPYVTVPVEIAYLRQGALEGAWRLEATDDPRDQRWFDRLMRAFLRHPWRLALFIVAAVTLLFVILLLIGPPGGR